MEQSLEASTHGQQVGQRRQWPSATGTTVPVSRPDIHHACAIWSAFGDSTERARSIAELGS